MGKRKIIPVLCATVVVANLAGCSDSSGSAAEKGTDTRAPKAEAGAEAEKGETAGTKKDEGGSGSANEKLVIYSPLTESIINSILAMFEEGTGINIKCLAMGTGNALKRIQTEAGNLQADILRSGTIGTIKNESEYLADYITPNEGTFYDGYKDTKGNLTRFDTIPSVIMANTDLIGDIKIEGYEDLLNPELRSRTAFADPAASSSSFEHLVNMLYAMGGGTPDNGWDYVERFCAQLSGELLGGSSAVYKSVTDGEHTVRLTFEQSSAQYVSAGAPVKTVYMSEGVIFRGDGVYVIKSCPDESNAQKFVDRFTSKDVQEFMNSTQHRRIIRKDVEAGDVMIPMDQTEMVQDSEADTAAHRSEWLDEFKELFIK